MGKYGIQFCHIAAKQKWSRFILYLINMSVVNFNVLRSKTVNSVKVTECLEIPSIPNTSSQVRPSGCIVSDQSTGNVLISDGMQWVTVSGTGTIPASLLSIDAIDTSLATATNPIGIQAIANNVYVGCTIGIPTGRNILAASSPGVAQTELGVVPGTDVQAYVF